MCDETGWRVNGENAWLHDFVTDELTYYLIDPTRSAEPARRVLSESYSGVMIHDGWSVYDQFLSARHQQCLSHLIRRCQALLETASAGAVRFPRAILALFERAMAARRRHRNGVVSTHGLKVIGGQLTSAMSRLVSPVKTHAANERLAAHLERHVGDLFTFLRVPGVDATNWRSEQELRPAVVNRKVWGGNRTWQGAATQSVLMTLLATCRRQNANAIDFLAQAMRGTAALPVLEPMR